MSTTSTPVDVLNSRQSIMNSCAQKPAAQIKPNSNLSRLIRHEKLSVSLCYMLRKLKKYQSKIITKLTSFAKDQTKAYSTLLTDTRL